MPTPRPPDSFNFAPPAPFLSECFAAFLPPERISTADCAAAVRYLPNHARWSHARVPYDLEIQDAYDDPDHTTVVVVGPGQCGKTASAENYFLKTVRHDPADILWYSHTDSAIEEYVKQTINPMVESHPDLRDRLGRQRVDNSLSFKRFGPMTVRFSAFTHSNLVARNAPRIIADEYDAYDPNVGDPKTLLDVRRQTYGKQSKLIVLSHPDRAHGSKPADWDAGIMALYKQSDQRTWWWACPHCGLYSSPNPGAHFHMPITYDDQAPIDRIAEEAHLLCPHNGCIIADKERRAMNATGRWVARGQTIDEETGELAGERIVTDTAGFWIVGAMSLLNNGIGHLAAERVKAQRAWEATGDDRTLVTVMAKQWGVPRDKPRRFESLDATVLADRADAALKLGEVPEFVRFITAAIDVQGNRFEYLARGWGAERESVVIDRRVVTEIDGAPVDPANDPGCWDAMLDQALAAEYPLADGSGRVMRVKATGVDSGGAPGVTEQAQRAWRRLREQRKIRFEGTVAGRRTTNLLLLRGVPKPNAKNLTVVTPEEQGGGRKAARLGIPRGDFNPNVFKSILASQLGRAAPGPSFVHIPAALRSVAPPHAWFEQLTAEQPNKNGAWVKKSDAARNEALDLMVMCAVMAHLHAPSRFDWTMQHVAPWARGWDMNSLVATPATEIPRGQDTRPISQQEPTIVATRTQPAEPGPPRGLPVAANEFAIRKNWRQLAANLRPGGVEARP